MLVDELRRRARREGYEKLCAFTHAPGYFIQHGLLDRAAPLAAREGLHRLREVPAVPAVRPVRDGRCRSIAAFDAERRATALPVAAPRMSAHDGSNARDDRRAASPRRAASAPPASAPASRPSRRRSISRCSSPTRRRTAAAVFTTNHAQAAPVARLARAPRAIRRRGARDRRQQRLRERLHRRRGHARRARRWRPRRRALVGCPAEQVLVASTGVIGVALPMDKIRSGLPAAFARARRRSGRRRGARDHDDRSVPEGSGGARSASAAATIDDRRHGQGLRHDRADDGDDARRS